MQVAEVNFSQFSPSAGAEAGDLQRRIADARQRLGERAVLLAHHYQRADVYCHADITGDSLGLSRQAAKTDADFVVFCGVHFMAEVADILTDDRQRVIFARFGGRLLNGRHGVAGEGAAVLGRIVDRP